MKCYRTTKNPGKIIKNGHNTEFAMLENPPSTSFYLFWCHVILLHFLIFILLISTLLLYIVQNGYLLWKSKQANKTKNKDGGKSDACYQNLPLWIMIVIEPVIVWQAMVVLCSIILIWWIKNCYFFNHHYDFNKKGRKI